MLPASIVVDLRKHLECVKSLYAADSSRGSGGVVLPQRAVTTAARDASVSKRVGCRTMRHSFATHLLEDGYDIPT
jgi:site-specific recombinase XerD